MTLGNAAAARVRLIVWCKACGHQVELMLPRWLRSTVPRPPFPIVRPARLLPVRQPQGRHGRDRDRAAVALTGPSYLNLPADRSPPIAVVRALFARRLRRAVYRRIRIQHASRIGHGCAGIERNGDTKSLSYFFAGRPGIDGAVGVHANAAVAASGYGDGDGDEFAGLGVEMGSLAGALVERDKPGNRVWRQLRHLIHARGELRRIGGLRFIQSIGAGQFSREALKQHGVRLASARGVNARAVSEHLMALMLALARRLPEARDNQAKRVWRGMIGDITQREDELGGKTLLIVGLGQIGGRLAQLAKAFDMRAIGIRRDPRAGAGHADAVHAMSDLNALLPQADFVALTCPLTAETEKLIDGDALGRVKPSAYLLNAARGRVVDEPALVGALARRRIRGAALDVMVEEPLPAASPLWAMEHVLITPHTAGETCRYEDNVLAIMQENLARLWRGETELLSQVV
jgi:phosphoglycerate dehydrogenase-like enzyme